MAISFVSRPDEVTAVYLPVKYVLETDRFPNTRPGETGNLLGISRQITEFPGINIKKDDTVLTLGASLAYLDTGLTPNTGDFLLIEGSVGGIIDGIHRISQTSPADPAVIGLETKYPDGIPDVFNTIGNVSIYYSSLSIVVDVYVNGQIRHRTRRQADPNGQYPFDLSDTVRLFVGSDLQTIGVDTVASGSDSIASFYIDYAEEFIVFNETTGEELVLQAILSDITNTFQSVNSVIQYIDIRNFTINSTTYSLADYIVTPTDAGQFLTKQPSTLKIGSAEEYQLMAVIQKDNTNILGNVSGTTGDFEDGVLGVTAEAGVLATFGLGINNTEPRSGHSSLTAILDGSADNLWSTNVGGTVFTAATKYKVTGWVKFDVAPSTNKEDFEITFGSRNFSDGSGSDIQVVNGLVQNKANVYYYIEFELNIDTDTSGEIVCQCKGTDRINLNGVVFFFDDIKIEVKEFEVQRKVIERDSAGGTTITNTDLVATNNSYIFSAGTNNLSLLGSTVGYDVVLIDKNTTSDITNLLTFEIDTKCTRNELRFAWVNDKGGIDQYTFRGELVQADEVARQTFKRELSDIRTIPERQLTEAWVRPQTVFSIGSGLVNLETVEWLKSIYRSPEKYIIVDGQYLPIFIRDTSPEISKSSDRLHNITIEFIFAFDEIVQQN